MPAFTARGGITNYYQVLKHEFPSEIEYFERGARTWPVRKGIMPELVRACKDYKRFKKRIACGDISLVQSTTSLGLSTTIRDGLFLRYAHKKGIKTIAFFRGWDDNAEQKIEKAYLWLFRYFFFMADALIALSERTGSTLQKWGFKGKIYIETTLVDRHLIQDVTRENIISKYNGLNKSQALNLLFLSRVERRKGIYELIEAYKALRTYSYPHITLTVCGDGFELEPLRQLVENEKLKGITIKGFISGEDKKQAYSNAHMFVFPSHGEGMPNAVLEAMGFGLPVIATSVGGLKDFFEEGVNGFFSEINNYTNLAKKIETLAANPTLLTKIALNNHDLAKVRFRSDKVASRIISIFKEVISSR